MDFPLQLKTGVFITGQDEFKQCILILLKEEAGAFLQNFTLGSKVSIHSLDSLMIEEAIRLTLLSIQGCVIEDLTVDDSENVYMTLKYKDDVVNFNFKLKDIYDSESNPDTN